MGAWAEGVCVLGALLMVGAAVPGGIALGPPVELPVTVAAFAPMAHTHTYGGKAWWVVHGTGNCCENYLAATPTGRLLDFGGTYIAYTDNAGATWSRILPLSPQLSGEGAIAWAPNGDVVGVGWDPYSGDHVTTYRYTASTGAWSYMEQVLRTPFFDRPWLAVFEGPFTVGGGTVPYLSVLKGGWPSKELYYYSADGLNYLHADSPYLDTIPGTVTTAALAPAGAANDWLQPLFDTGLSPAGPGQGLSARVDYPNLGACAWRMLDASADWDCFTTPGGLGDAGWRTLADGAGNLHQLRSGACAGLPCFSYRWSGDGGTTWASTSETIPNASALEELDWRVSAALGKTVIAVHAHRSDAPFDKDLLYVYQGFPPALAQVLPLGNADWDFASGAGATYRFDFATVALLPSGKVAMSFVDAAHTSPALAIEP